LNLEQKVSGLKIAQAEIAAEQDGVFLGKLPRTCQSLAQRGRMKAQMAGKAPAFSAAFSRKTLEPLANKGAKVGRLEDTCT
jgi:hypothetical protein